MTKEAFRGRLRGRAALAASPIGDAAIDALQEYFELLAHWNRTINLTALPLDPPTDEALDRLLIEPVAAAHYIRHAVGSAPQPVWFDVGSGGGSPAIPLKIVEPDLRLTMTEARTRKAAFLTEAVRRLKLRDAVVANGRFEELTVRDATVDLVTVRAVRGDALLSETAGRLLKDGGVLAAFGTSPLPAEQWNTEATIQLLSWTEVSRLSVIRRVPRGTKPLTAI